MSEFPYRYLLGGKFYREDEIIRPFTIGPIATGVIAGTVQPANPIMIQVPIGQIVGHDIVLETASVATVGLAIGTANCGCRLMRNCNANGTGGFLVLPQLGNAFPQNITSVTAQDLAISWIHAYPAWSPLDFHPIRIKSGENIWIHLYNNSALGLSFFLQIRGHYEKSGSI